MSAQVRELNGMRVVEADRAGPPVRGDRDAADLVGLAMEHDARCVAAPVERLGDDFFRLETRIAGEVAQKCVNYGIRLAVVGDISAYLERSMALRDYVYECNLGRHVWFVEDLAALEHRLASA